MKHTQRNSFSATSGILLSATVGLGAALVLIPLNSADSYTAKIFLVTILAFITSAYSLFGWSYETAHHGDEKSQNILGRIHRSTFLVSTALFVAGLMYVIYFLSFGANA